MTVVAVESGRGDGYTATINSDGELLADVEEVQRIVEPVTTRPEVMYVTTSTPAVLSGTSSQVVGTLTERRWLEIQNLGDFPVHILLADSPATASVANRRLDPGDVYSWRNGVSYDGAVQAIAIGGVSSLAIDQFYTAP